jgi:glycosyltransferase involved in cell wall biosynthesis
MYVSGLTILRNAVRLGYCFEESIRSALPICDEFVVVVGDSEDGTLEAVRAMNEPKVHIVETVWSDRVEPRRYVLSQQTNIGLHMCRGDWVVYLQANEVLHEASLPVLTALMEKHNGDAGVEALLLERLVFWGDFDHYVGVYPNRFKYSPRIVRPYRGTYAVRDAMSFAVFDRFGLKGRYPRAVDTGQDLYRYSWVLDPEQTRRKHEDAVHLADCKERMVDEGFFYTHLPKQHVLKFGGTQPEVMREHIDAFSQRLSLDDERWRTDPSWRERRRSLESWYYRRFGLPRFRDTRYRLQGGYVRKER